MKNDSATLESRTQNTAALGWATLIAGGAVAVYGLVNAWATFTSGLVILSLGARDYGAAPTGEWAVAPGASLTWPYRVVVRDGQVPAAARWLVQGGQALTPLLWAATLAALGLVLVRVGTARSVFDRPVRRAVAILAGTLAALALIPTGLVLFGTNWAVGRLGWAANTVTELPTLWFPLFAFYLCVAFGTTLRHGARLASELDQVI